MDSSKREESEPASEPCIACHLVNKTHALHAEVPKFSPQHLQLQRISGNIAGKDLCLAHKVASYVGDSTLHMLKVPTSLSDVSSEGKMHLCRGHWKAANQRGQRWGKWVHGLIYHIMRAQTHVYQRRGTLPTEMIDMPLKDTEPYNPCC